MVLQPASARLGPFAGERCGETHKMACFLEPPARWRDRCAGGPSAGSRRHDRPFAALPAEARAGAGRPDEKEHAIRIVEMARFPELRARSSVCGCGLLAEAAPAAASMRLVTPMPVKLETTAPMSDALAGFELCQFFACRLQV